MFEDEADISARDQIFFEVWFWFWFEIELGADITIGWCDKTWIGWCRTRDGVNAPPNPCVGCSSDGNGESDGDRVGDANGDDGSPEPEPDPEPSLWEEYPDSSAFKEFISANEVPKFIF